MTRDVLDDRQLTQHFSSDVHHRRLHTSGPSDAFGRTQPSCTLASIIKYHRTPAHFLSTVGHTFLRTGGVSPCPNAH